MRTYDAIDAVSKAMIKDEMCEAILVKGSIGRGDDDEFSDVDLYAVVKEDRLQEFMDKRMEYLENYLPIIYAEHVNFVAEQIVAIFDNGLHFDLYTVTADTLPRTDMAKVIYDPDNKFKNYVAEIRVISDEELADYFNNTLYYFIEADGAYCRKNYPWAAHIMTASIAGSAVLLRYIYDKDHAYLGLKKLNEIIPEEQFFLIEKASENLCKNCFRTAGDYIIRILEYVMENIDNESKSKFNRKFYEWIKSRLGVKMFIKE